MSLPSSVPWRVCDRCGLGHHEADPCERKAPPTSGYLAARKVAKPTSFVPPRVEDLAS